MVFLPASRSFHFCGSHGFPRQNTLGHAKADKKKACNRYDYRLLLVDLKRFDLSDTSCGRWGERGSTIESGLTKPRTNSVGLYAALENELSASGEE